MTTITIALSEERLGKLKELAAGWVSSPRS